jgi:hypothetical protein
MTGLNGSWFYESFCPRGETQDGPAQLAAPWAPRGELTVSTDAEGNVTGTLKFAPGVELAVTGTTTPATGNLPEGVDLVGEGLGSVNQIRGFWIVGTGSADSAPVIVGRVVAVKNDLAKQPDGTSGPFILFPDCGKEKEVINHG